MTSYTKQLALTILFLLICCILAYTIGRDTAGLSTITYERVI